VPQFRGVLDIIRQPFILSVISMTADNGPANRGIMR